MRRLHETDSQVRLQVKFKDLNSQLALRQRRAQRNHEMLLHVQHLYETIYAVRMHGCTSVQRDVSKKHEQ